MHLSLGGREKECVVRMTIWVLPEFMKIGREEIFLSTKTLIKSLFSQKKPPHNAGGESAQRESNPLLQLGRLR